MLVHHAKHICTCNTHWSTGNDSTTEPPERKRPVTTTIIMLAICLSILASMPFDLRLPSAHLCAQCGRKWCVSFGYLQCLAQNNLDAIRCNVTYLEDAHFCAFVFHDADAADQMSRGTWHKSSQITHIAYAAATAREPVQHSNSNRYCSVHALSAPALWWWWWWPVDTLISSHPHSHFTGTVQNRVQRLCNQARHMHITLAQLTSSV